MVIATVAIITGGVEILSQFLVIQLVLRKFLQANSFFPHMYIDQMSIIKNTLGEVIFQEICQLYGIVILVDLWGNMQLLFENSEENMSEMIRYGRILL